MKMKNISQYEKYFSIYISQMKNISQYVLQYLLKIRKDLHEQTEKLE